MTTKELILKHITKKPLSYQQLIEKIRTKTKYYNGQTIERAIRHLVKDGYIIKSTKKFEIEDKIKRYAVFSKGVK